MNENQSRAASSAPKTLSVSYRHPIRTAIVWFVILLLWCGAAIDTGESAQAFQYALGVYFMLLLLVMLRRPATPSRLDLLLVGWGLPVLFFLLLCLLPLAWHIRGIA